MSARIRTASRGLRALTELEGGLSQLTLSDSVREVDGLHDTALMQTSLPPTFRGLYHATICLPCRTNASRSALMVPASVVGIPCGKPLYVFSVPFFSNFADSGAESAYGTIWSSSP